MMTFILIILAPGTNLIYKQTLVPILSATLALQCGLSFRGLIGSCQAWLVFFIIANCCFLMNCDNFLTIFVMVSYLYLLYKLFIQFVDHFNTANFTFLLNYVDLASSVLIMY